MFRGGSGIGISGRLARSAGHEGHELFEANAETVRQGAKHPDGRLVKPTFKLAHIGI